MYVCTDWLCLPLIHVLTRCLTTTTKNDGSVTFQPEHFRRLPRIRLIVPTIGKSLNLRLHGWAVIINAVTIRLNSRQNYYSRGFVAKIIGFLMQY